MQVTAKLSGFLFQSLFIRHAPGLFLPLPHLGSDHRALRHGFVDEFRDLENVAILRGHLVDLRPQFLQGFHDKGLRVECFLDVVVFQAPRGRAHVFLREKHHRAGFNFVRQRIKGSQCRIDRMDQVFLRDNESRIVLWFGFPGDPGQLNLLVLDLNQQWTRGKDTPGDPKHPGKGRSRCRQSLDQTTGLFDHIERLLLGFDCVIGLVVLEQWCGGIQSVRNSGEAIQQRQKFFALRPLGFVPEDDGSPEPLRILGQGLINGSEEVSVDLVISGILHLLKQHQQTLLKHEQLGGLLPEAVDGRLHLLLLSHGLHPFAGYFSQVGKSSLGTLLMTGRRLTVPRFDLNQGRGHQNLGGGKRASDRRCGQRDGVEELGTMSRDLRHEQHLDLSLQIGLGLGKSGFLFHKFLYRQCGSLFPERLMTGGLRGEDVAGNRQRLVFGTESQPELRMQQSRDHLGLQTCRFFEFRFRNESGGLAHLGIGTRTNQPIDKAGQLKSDQRIHADALFVAWRGRQQTGGLFCKNGLRLLEVIPIDIVTGNCLQAQGGLGLSRGMQFASHDIRGFSKPKLQDHET